jgi:hypothetical protein
LACGYPRAVRVSHSRAHPASVCGPSREGKNKEKENPKKRLFVQGGLFSLFAFPFFAPDTKKKTRGLCSERRAMCSTNPLFFFSVIKLPRTGVGRSGAYQAWIYERKRKKRKKKKKTRRGNAQNCQFDSAVGARCRRGYQPSPERRPGANRDSIERCALKFGGRGRCPGTSCNWIWTQGRGKNSRTPKVIDC